LGVRCSRPKVTTCSTASKPFPMKSAERGSGFLPGEPPGPTGQKQHVRFGTLDIPAFSFGRFFAPGGRPRLLFFGAAESKGGRPRSVAGCSPVRLLPNGRGSVNPCKCTEDFRAARVSKRLARNDSRYDFGRTKLGSWSSSRLVLMRPACPTWDAAPVICDDDHGFPEISSNPSR
jgi:hypothetical protein